MCRRFLQPWRCASRQRRYRGGRCRTPTRRSALDSIRFTKGKLCNVAETPVNNGLVVLRISVTKWRHEIRLCAGIDGRPDPCLQLAALKKAGCKTVFKEPTSPDGKCIAPIVNPPGLRSLLP